MLVRISRAAINDFADIMKLKRQLQEISIENERPTEKELREMIGEKIKREDGIVLIAKMEKETVGFLSGYIENIFIKENFRNRSISEKLINEFQKWVYEKNIKIIKTKLYPRDKKTDNFYNKKGFADEKTYIDDRGYKILEKILTIN